MKKQKASGGGSLESRGYLQLGIQGNQTIQAGFRIIYGCIQGIPLHGTISMTVGHPGQVIFSNAKRIPWIRMQMAFPIYMNWVMDGILSSPDVSRGRLRKRTRKIEADTLQQSRRFRNGNSFTRFSTQRSWVNPQPS